MARHRETAADTAVAIAGRLPPHDLDAEAAGLSTVMLEPYAIEIVSSVTRPEDHYSAPNRMILEGCIELHRNGRPIDVVSVASWLRSREWLTKVGGATYLAQLVDATPSTTKANLAAYARTVADLARLRRMISVFQILVAEGYGPEARSDIGAWIAEALRRVTDTAVDGSAGCRGRSTDEFFAQYLEGAENAEPLEAPPLVYTGIRGIDQWYGPMRGKQFIGVLAFSGNGKSSLCTTIAANVASVAFRAACGACGWEGINPGMDSSTQAALVHCPVCVRTCECKGRERVEGCSSHGLGGRVPQGIYLWTGADMSDVDYNARLVSRFAGCTANKVVDILEGRAPELRCENPGDAELLEAVGRAIRRLRSKYVRVVDDASMTIEDIAEDIYATRATFERDGVPLRLAVADYFQHIDTRDPLRVHGSKEKQLTHVAQTWKTMCKRANVVGIMPAQANEEARKQGRPPLAHDVRDSKSWHHEADRVIAIHNPTRDAAHDSDAEEEASVDTHYGASNDVREPAKLIIAKNRAGRKGYAKTAFLPATTTFVDWNPSWGEWRVK
jgi:replicative DNA helicase